ncbi:MAG: PP2C family serine/threonine-protein phosphatase [bacterium]|nr:PP2C family serine/threonine-protein phosphatase [bacterium]
MSIFRRLFGQVERKQEPPTPQSEPKAAASNPAPNAANTPSTAPDTGAGDKAARLPIETDTRPVKPVSPTGALGDGVTRPLPQDVFMEVGGNQHLSFGQVTDVGMVRTNNQDTAFSIFSASRSVLERPDFGLFIVADGMGGHHDGEKASALAARSVAVQLTTKIYTSLIAGDDRYNEIPVVEAMTEAILKANADVVAKVPDGGTTLSSIMILGDMAYMAHVGDSRIYLIHRDKIEQLTRDHSLVQRLIELDQLTPEEAVDHPQKNVLYRALGQTESIEVDTLTRRLPPHSRILVCSDGLWNQVNDREIWQTVQQYSNPQEACNELVKKANASGGLDNVTVILLQLPG